MNFLIETIYHQKYPLSTSYGHLRGKEDQMDIYKTTKYEKYLINLFTDDIIIKSSFSIIY